MSSQEVFSNYVEALNALSSVDRLRREALRKAVESSAVTLTQAKTAVADQQRMYARAAQDADAAGRVLAELRTALGQAQAPRITATPSAGSPRSLVEIRAQIRQVSDWAIATKPIAESLVRTKSRQVVQPPTPRPVALPPPSSAPAPNRRRLLAIVAALIVVVVVILIVLIAL